MAYNLRAHHVDMTLELKLKIAHHSSAFNWLANDENKKKISVARQLYN